MDLSSLQEVVGFRACNPIRVAIAGGSYCGSITAAYPGELNGFGRVKVTYRRENTRIF